MTISYLSALSSALFCCLKIKFIIKHGCIGYSTLKLYSYKSKNKSIHHYDK